MHWTVKSYSILLFYIFSCNSPSFGKNLENLYSIQDTSELREIIQKQISSLKTSKNIPQDSVTDLLKTALILKDTISSVYFCTNVANYYKNDQRHEDGIKWLQTCVNLLEDSPQTHFGYFYNRLGNFYLELGYYIDALENYFKSLEWCKRYHEEFTAVPLGNIAETYFENEEYDKSLKYNQEALSSSLKIKNKNARLHNLVYDYYRNGVIYAKLKKDDEAKTYYEKSLKTAKELGYSDLMLLATYEAFKFYGEQENYSKCSQLINEGDKLIKGNINATQLITQYKIEKSNLYLKTNQISKAVNPSDLDFEAALLREEKYKYAADYYIAKEDLNNSKKYYELLLSEKNRIDKKSRVGVLANIENEYKTKELEIENKILIEQTVRKTNYLYSIIGLLVMISSLFFLQRHNNTKTKKLNISLERKTEELKETNQHLANSNEELERFAYIASHDLKTPLRNIISFTGLLEKKLSSKNDVATQEYLHFIKDGGKRMNTLIEDVLEYSKLSKLEESEAPQLVNLNELINEISNSISAYLKDRNAKIERLSALPNLRCQHSKVFILFKNIIENGIKYNQSGTPIIKIYAEIKAETYVIYIEDNGIGVREEFHSKIFTMFKRLHNHSEYEGTGLGLATCKKIVTELNGKIYIESKIGKGTIFKIELPVNLFVGIKEEPDLLKSQQYYSGVT